MMRSSLTLKVLDRICQEDRTSGKLGDPQHVDHLLEFFTVFVDKCHHGKEEELLFPALEQIGVAGTRVPSESCSESMNWGVNACRK